MSVSNEHLKTFIAVAACGSMKTAAEELLLSRSCVSKHVNALERRLRTELFTRGHAGCELTPAGYSALELARNIVALHDAFRNVASGPVLPAGARGTPAASARSGGQTPRCACSARQTAGA